MEKGRDLTKQNRNQKRLRTIALCALGGFEEFGDPGTSAEKFHAECTKITKLINPAVALYILACCYAGSVNTDNKPICVRAGHKPQFKQLRRISSKKLAYTTMQ